MVSALSAAKRLSPWPAAALTLLIPALAAWLWATAPFRQVTWLPAMDLFPWRVLATLALTWWIPGLWLAFQLSVPGDMGRGMPALSAPAFLLLAFGLGLSWMILFALAIHWLPGAVTLWQVLVVYGVGALLLAGGWWLRWSARTQALPRPHAAPRSLWAWGLLLLLIAVMARLPGIGYHEFHADEVVLLRQAGRSIEGQDDALSEHTKGPGEIVITLAQYATVGTADEWSTRQPFALMSVASILATAWLGYRLFWPTAGFWAGILLAANGFALGLSRIAQYQPAVLLLSVLAVWTGWEFSRSSDRRWLLLTATFAATGLVMHYEYGLLAPALLYLVWTGWRRSTAEQKPLLARTVLWAGLGGAFVVAAAYVPAFFHPYFATTQGYLTNRLGEVGVFNLAFFLEMGTFYNSTYFFVGLIALVGAGMWLALRAEEAQTRQAGILLSLWWLPFFVLYIFVVRYPGTHFYLLMESWSLLAALPLAWVVRTRRLSPAIRTGLLGLTTFWLFISAYYLYLIFFRQNPEYLVNYEQEQNRFYWAPFPVPEKPRFGFPIYEGWKTLGVLGAWGYLGEEYASNDGAWSIRRWYLTPFDKRYFDETPDNVFLARHVQEANPDYDDAAADLVENAYYRIGEVRVRGEPRIELWAREPLPVAYVTFDAEHFADSFARTVAAWRPWPDPPMRAQNEPLSDAIHLTSAHVESEQYAPGEILHLLLVWEPNRILDKDYKLFVHLAGEDGRPVAQWDGLPGMNTAHTSQWRPNETFRDHVLLPILEDTVPGDYVLRVGLYDGATGDRLGDRAIDIMTIHVR